mgnify:CR=1 FL=1
MRELLSQLIGRGDWRQVLVFTRTKHGANRLASNSLLEALVFAHRAGAAVRQWVEGEPPPLADPWIVPTTGTPREDVIVEHNWSAVRRLMWDYVGIERSDEVGESLRQHVATKIGAISRPKLIMFTDDLPKTNVGKILRRALRDE